VKKKLIIAAVISVVVFFIYHRTSSDKIVQKNIQIGAEFLVENAQQKGVKSTASGLQYKMLTKGAGTTHPTEDSNITVHYHGTLIDGTVFDSSMDRGEPVSFDVNQAIPGWREGIQLMVEGDKFRLYIPSDLAYGDRNVGKIPAGSLLIFDVELIAIN
jgi:peptidylprolyl isomerase